MATRQPVDGVQVSGTAGGGETRNDLARILELQEMVTTANQTAPPADADADARRPPLLDGASTVRLALAAVGAVLLLRSLERLQDLLVVLLLAVFGAVALDPPVRMVQRRGVPRGAAAAIVAVLLVAAGVLVGWLVFGPLLAELSRLGEALPGYVDRFADSSFADRLDQLPGSDPADALASQARETIPQWLGAIATWLVSIATSAILLLALTILIVISAPSIVAGLLTTFPALAKRGPWRVLDGAYHDVSRYAGGQLGIAFIAGSSAYVAMLVIGVPQALALAAFIAVFAVVPIVGAFVGGGAAVLVAAADEWWKGAAMLGFLVVYQQVESNVLAPAILGRAVRVSAFVILLAIAAGYALLGIPGMIVAVPVAGALQAVLAEYQRTRQEEHPALAETAEQRIEEIEPGR